MDQLAVETEFCRVKETRRVGGEVHQLVRFEIPKSGGNRKRKEIVESTLRNSGADALIEVFWSGGIIHKGFYAFDAILVYDDKRENRL